VDVFIAAPATVGGFTEIVTIRVYSIAQGVRSLVSSGRYGPTLADERWICAARGAADRYEVTIQNGSGSPAIAVGTFVQLSVVGVDQAPEAPDYVGTESLSPFADMSMTTVVQWPVVAPDIQVVAAQATSLVAGARWFQVHDSAVALIAGVRPVFSFGLVGVGTTLILQDLEKLFASRRFRNGLIGAVSTTGATFTAAVDPEVAWGLWFR
jgi:hypothetical protein